MTASIKFALPEDRDGLTRLMNLAAALAAFPEEVRDAMADLETALSGDEPDGAKVKAAFVRLRDGLTVALPMGDANSRPDHRQSERRETAMTKTLKKKIRAAGNGRVKVTMSCRHVQTVADDANRLRAMLDEVQGALELLSMQDDLNQLADPKAARFGAVLCLANRTMAEAMKGPLRTFEAEGALAETMLSDHARRRDDWMNTGEALGVIE